MMLELLTWSDEETAIEPFPYTYGHWKNTTAVKASRADRKQRKQCTCCGKTFYEPLILFHSSLYVLASPCCGEDFIIV